MTSPSEDTVPTPPAPPENLRSPREILQHAQTLSAAGWHPEAMALLKELAETPTGAHPRFRIVLTEVLLAAGLFDQADRITVSGPLPPDLAGADNPEEQQGARS